MAILQGNHQIHFIWTADHLTCHDLCTLGNMLGNEHPKLGVVLENGEDSLSDAPEET